MNNLKRNKKTFYVCNQKEEDGRLVYDEPKKMVLNYQPVSMVGEIIAFGSEYINRLIIYTTAENAKNLDQEIVKISNVAWDKLKSDLSEEIGYITKEIRKYGMVCPSFPLHMPVFVDISLGYACICKTRECEKKVIFILFLPPGFTQII